MNKTSAVLTKWYVELKKCLTEDYRIKAGCGECAICTFVILISYNTKLCLQKNDTDVAHYNFNAHQLTLIILGRDVAEYAMKW